MLSNETYQYQQCSFFKLWPFAATIKQNPTNQVQSLLQEAQIGVYGGSE